MAKSSSKFVCQQCGYSQAGWAGRCPNCQAWGSLVETIEETRSTRSARSGREGGIEVKELSKVKDETLKRISTGIAELDRVLGSGLVPGQTVLFAGEPGIGKSTILSQVASKIYSKSLKKAVLYVSGEESAGQVKLRAKRLGVDTTGIFIIEDTDVDELVSQIRQMSQIGLIVIDSIQTLTTSDLTGAAGSIGQVRECALRVADFCKKNSIPLFLVGHVTKEGSIAGPRVLEHMVDTVLWFEGDRAGNLRILRAVKNRFGPTDEIGIFTMGERGLELIDDPSNLFLSGVSNVAGSLPTVILEGTRPVIVEIQSLVVPTKMPYPKRIFQGVDTRRAELMIAVVSGRAGLPLGGFDVFINAVGGINLKEPAADLAVVLSVASAFANKPLPAKTIAFGEVGLLGEIRAVPQEARRIKEARRLGFRNIITRTSARTISEAIRKYLR
ncbi:DNA repair protein RadA [Candidatus Microgenomates bacterium]|nr:DNA repair protein RadA [Candidatus Microgenomates bacterium]